jgi:methionyl-tRNA formyltransferase
MEKSIRTVFMGSPDFALPILTGLAEAYNVVGVVTQPDKPAGRGRVITPPPVKDLAKALGIPIIQPYRMKETDAMERLAEWAPQIIVVAAFGQILRQEVLDLPHYGCINVHASLLPRWRGAAPIQAAIVNGDDVTGISIMKMDAGMDTGDVLRQRAIPIGLQDNGGSLSERLSKLGANLLIETLREHLDGKITPQQQDDTKVTYAPKLDKSAGALDFNRPAEHLARLVRAFNPWPGAYTMWHGQMLKIHHAHSLARQSPGCGVFFTEDGYPAVGTREGILVLDVVQPAGKKAMPGNLFLHGAKTWSQG